MKKTLLTIFLSSLYIGVLSQIKINPKIGINLSNFTQHDEILESEAQIGFSAGVDVRLGNRLYFAPGLYYLSATTKVKKVENITVDEIITFNTIELPLSVGFNIIDNELIKISIKAGIEGAYFANIKELEMISIDDVNRLNWGYQFGAGVDVKRFTFDIKYDLGKNTILKEDLIDNINPQYNRVHLYFGYLIFKA
jgi:hypothetical protein